MNHAYIGTKLICEKVWVWKHATTDYVLHHSCLMGGSKHTTYQIDRVDIRLLIQIPSTSSREERIKVKRGKKNNLEHWINMLDLSLRST